MAKLIQRQVASKEGPIIPLVAETGGINAMVVDSSALTEQVVTDVVLSAFGSAGQRCSALRVLFIQEEVADKTIEMLIGAMQMLNVGNPKWLSTDIGPIIDDAALQLLEQHVSAMKKVAKLLYQIPLESDLNGSYFAPCVFELETLTQLKQEVFGPILHVVRYRRADLDGVIADINELGYGLTFGIHSRINSTIDELAHKIRAGNIYVNRSTIGAVVGLQPFGGCGLSGTGPKAGGPFYLHRFCRETTVSTDTTAAGGNASLLTQNE